MSHIKKLHLEGFKSFAKPTDIIFSKGMNVIVGANGSGKSNITDALCFVLGRLRVKSLRASKAANLIYHGSKTKKPGQSAKVSLVFDNSSKIFSLPVPSSEVEISRTVKKEGTSVYKINGQTKTRQEILELLAQAGIDPEGFNIIMQAEINKVIQMRPEEKREIIEEIAGISIYESRKERSLRELNKTEDKLKTVRTILNERSAYMRNLEREKNQAEKYEKLKKDIARDKISILWKNIEKKKKQASKTTLEINEKKQEIDKITDKSNKLLEKIENCKQNIEQIDENITKKTGVEQEKLRDSILNLKTHLNALNLKKENFSDQINNIITRNSQLNAVLKKTGQEITDLESEKVKSSVPDKDKTRKRDEIEKLKQELEKTKKIVDNIENKKHHFYILQNEIGKKEAKVSEKENYLLSLNQEIVEIKKEVNELRAELALKEHKNESMDELIKKRTQNNNLHENLVDDLKKIEKEIMYFITKKDIQKKDFEDIINLDKCPTCKQIVSKDHKNEIEAEFQKFAKVLKEDLLSREEIKNKLNLEIKKIADKIEKNFEKERNLEAMNETRMDFEKKDAYLKNLDSKKESIIKRIKDINLEIGDIKKQLIKPEFLETEYAENKAKLEDIQEKLLMIKVDKYEFTDKNYEIEISIKAKEIENARAITKGLEKEKIEIELKLKTIRSEIIEKQKELEKNEMNQEKINNEFKAYLEKKQKSQDAVHDYETGLNELQTKKIGIEYEINDLKITMAKVSAEIEAVEIEFKEFNTDGKQDDAGNDAKIEIVKNLTPDELEKRLRKNEVEIQKFGAVNFKALEVYEATKKEYDEISLKVEKLDEEKIEILKIVEEIDKKKKYSFMQAFNAINESFGENFMALSDKGRASFELENKQDPFAGGLNIVIKLAKGKYMDADSLSGGEKVIIALSLMFAIQKYKPYCFYVFDEIDPALDKRNSERLASILRKNVQNSQCIIISHNDSIIGNADILYGTTMQDGISKIISLKV